MRFPKAVRSRASYRFLERPLRQAERDARVEAALRVEGGQELLEPSSRRITFSSGSSQVSELDLREVLAAHRVIARGHAEAGRVPVDQYVPRRRPGLRSMRLNTTNHSASSARLISVFTPFTVARSPLIVVFVR